MAENAQTAKRNDEREIKDLKARPENWPTYKKPSYIGSYLTLFLFLAIVGMAVYYSLNHKEQVSMLWNRLTHHDRAPAQVEPGQ